MMNDAVPFQGRLFLFIGHLSDSQNALSMLALHCMGSSNTVNCPVCNEQVDNLVFRYHLDGEKKVIARIKEQNPDWEEENGACGRCFDYYHTQIIIQQQALPGIGPHFPVKSADDFVILPTGLRLDADPKYTGKGVTICFIDSGFYPHPDLVMHQNRIKLVVDIPGDRTLKGFDSMNQASAWHGTMTTVVCAGDGWLSNGLYKGIASDAELVLLKVQDEKGRISTKHIERALRWIADHHLEYNIRVVNISVGADEAIPYQESEIDQLAEQLIRSGIVIIAAVGNDEKGSIKPPANSPNVIAVGGIDDENLLGKKPAHLYHSSYGRVGEGIVKPELVAPAIWIAAPMLPGSREQKESELIHELLPLDDNDLMKKFDEFMIDTVQASGDPIQLRKELINRIGACKYISPHYIHVDGTSFAAPIVSAIAAQLLEANINLKPAIIREALLSTAKRIEGLDAARQGFGLVDPRKSLLQVIKRSENYSILISPHVDSEKHRIVFQVRHDCASQVALAGTFNHWAIDTWLMEPGKEGIWNIEIPMLPAGRYHYKFLVDDRYWLEDVNNPFREPDGFSGFNSILLIEN